MKDEEDLEKDLDQVRSGFLLLPRNHQYLGSSLLASSSVLLVFTSTCPCWLYLLHLPSQNSAGGPIAMRPWDQRPHLLLAMSTLVFAFLSGSLPFRLGQNFCYVEENVAKDRTAECAWRLVSWCSSCLLPFVRGAYHKDLTDCEVDV